MNEQKELAQVIHSCVCNTGRWYVFDVFAVKMNQLHVFMQDSFQYITLGLVNKVLFHNNLTFKYWQFLHLLVMFSHGLKLQLENQNFS